MSWQSARPVVSVPPRPGKVQTIDFPVATVAEIDGTVWLARGEGRQKIGNARLQLITPDGQIAGEAISASDGYFIVTDVRPGRYILRIDPAQLAQLALVGGDPQLVVVGTGTTFVIGIDVTVTPQN